MILVVMNCQLFRAATMNRRILFQFSAPAAIIGLLLFSVCLGSAWSIHRLQTNLTRILAENVTSLEAAQSLEINIRQLRFHAFMQVIDPNPERQALIDEDCKRFESAFRTAKENALPGTEMDLVESIHEGYAEYRAELNKDLPRPMLGVADFVEWTKKHPVGHLQKKCEDLLLLNKAAMATTAGESEEVGRQTRMAVLVLGVLGPFSGLFLGYGVSRAWSRSIARLSVQLHDMQTHLDRDVGELKLEFGKDWAAIDRQIDRVLVRVKQAAEQLQRQQQDLLRAEQLAAVGQLAASVAHEIRNPLTSIKILVDIARRPESPQSLTGQDLDVIHEEIGKLEQTVQTLLDYARPPKIQQHETDIRQVLTQAVNLVRPKAQQQGVTIDVCQPESTIPCWIDPGQMGNVFVNLLLNSMDALPEGGKIEIALEKTGASAVQVRVSDNGPGIADEMAPNLFRPFSSTKVTGTGLGLSICQRIVRDHDGSIEYDSPPGGGARFTVTLPKHAREYGDAAPFNR
jgi:signal transduction histidine kinase